MISNTPPAGTPPPLASCPVCHGTGEVVVIDEEVGCHVPMPCWACQDGPMPSGGYDRPIKGDQ